ncbi:MAG: hypothetical protein HY542_03480 [Deltaproteobacteria bacterium]|nr:hypothetical protein [Deltaproteobacteria bacterium]
MSIGVLSRVVTRGAQTVLPAIDDLKTLATRLVKDVREDPRLRNLLRGLSQGRLAEERDLRRVAKSLRGTRDRRVAGSWAAHDLEAGIRALLSEPSPWRTGAYRRMAARTAFPRVFAGGGGHRSGLGDGGFRRQPGVYFSS